MKKKGKNGINGKSEDAVFTVVIYEWTLVAPGSKIDKARHGYGTDKDKWKYKELHRRQYKSKELCRKRGDELETKEITEHDSVNKGFNGSYGRGMKGIHHKEESKRKMSEKKKGHTVDAPTRMKISKTQKKKSIKTHNRIVCRLRFMQIRPLVERYFHRDICGFMLYTPAPIKIKAKCQSHIFDFDEP